MLARKRQEFAARSHARWNLRKISQRTAVPGNVAELVCKLGGRGGGGFAATKSTGFLFLLVFVVFCQLELTRSAIPCLCRWQDRSARLRKISLNWRRPSETRRIRWRWRRHVYTCGSRGQTWSCAGTPRSTSQYNLTVLVVERAFQIPCISLVFFRNENSWVHFIFVSKRFGHTRVTKLNEGKFPALNVLQFGVRSEWDRGVSWRLAAAPERRRGGAQEPSGRPHGAGEGHLQQNQLHLHRQGQVYDAPHAVPHSHQTAGLQPVNGSLHIMRYNSLLNLFHLFTPRDCLVVVN